MEKGTKETVVAVAVAVAVVTAMFAGLYAYSGHWPPFSAVESGSMQHSERSTIVTIDTGDLVVVRSPDKVTIRTYVDGYKENYKKFGDYGDVIVYERTRGNPVIHRAVLWLEWNGDGTWSAPSLEGFPNWSCVYMGDGISDVNALRGILTITDYGHRSKDISLDLDNIAAVAPWSGYATKGDANDLFDFGDVGPGQVEGVSGLISEEDVLYVAGFTIPWLGVIKLYLSGNDRAMALVPSNSIPDLLATIAAIVVALFAVLAISEYVRWRRHGD